jgi:hypothetical protein
LDIRFQSTIIGRSENRDAFPEQTDVGNIGAMPLCGNRLKVRVMDDEQDDDLTKPLVRCFRR